MKAMTGFLAASVLAMGGCASLFSNTPDELRDIGTQSDTLCSTAPLPLLENRFREYFQKCYSGTYPYRTNLLIGYAYVPINGSMTWSAHEEKVGTETRFSVKDDEHYYFEVRLSEAGTGAGGNCRSLMRFTVLNTFWTNRFDAFQNVAQGKPIDCGRNR